MSYLSATMLRSINFVKGLLLRLVVVLLLISIHSSNCYSQVECNRKAHWFFGKELFPGGASTGNVMHMEFQCPSGNLISTGPAPGAFDYGFEGSAVINDFNNGNWKLFSDGDHIVFSAAPQTNNLGGNFSGSQSVAFSPINYCPMDSFYVFTNPTGAGSSFGTIEWARINTTGSVSSQTAVPMPTSAQVGGATSLIHGEGMLVVPNPVQIGNYWLITRLAKNGGAATTDAFVVYEVTPLGVSINQVFNINTDGNNNIADSQLGAAFLSFEYNKVRDEIAVADYNTSTSVFTIPFESSTGLFSGSLSNVISLSPSGAYDVEYSPDNNYLYYSDYGNARVYAYNLSTFVSTLILSSAYPSNKRSAGIQTGPDGNMYAITFNSPNWSDFTSQIWQISNPNSPAYVAAPMQNFPNFKCGNLPSFVTPVDLDLVVSSGGYTVCSGDSVQIEFLSDLSALSIDSVIWHQNGQIIPGESDTTLWVTNPGDYSGLIVLGGACSFESNIVQITTGIMPVVDAGPDVTICPGDQVTLTATNPNGATLTWNNGILDGVPFIANVADTFVVAADLNGCIAYDSVNIILNSVLILNVPNDTSLCVGDTYTLQIGNPNGLNITINPVVSLGVPFTPVLGSTTYYIEGDINGCAIQDSLVIMVNEYPIITVPADTSLCEGNQLSISAGVQPNSVVLTWSGGITNGGLFAPAIGTNEYVVSANNFGCISTDSIIVEVNPNPTMTLTTTEPVPCGTDLGSILIEGFGIDPIVHFIDGQPTTSYITDLDYGIYEIAIVDSNGCETTQTVEFVESAHNEVYFSYSPQSPFDLGQLVNFTSFTEGATNYWWEITGAGYSYSSTDSTFSIVFPDVEGEYTICLVAQFGESCFDTLCVTIAVIDELLIFVPNTFTPNGDENNNLFFPVFSDLTKIYSFELEIFNRWGELIWVSHSPSGSWDGIYNGAIVQDGVYVWKIKYSDDSQMPIELTGHVNVIK